jgi:hypothetical protein
LTFTFLLKVLFITSHIGVVRLKQLAGLSQIIPGFYDEGADDEIMRILHVVRLAASAVAIVDREVPDEHTIRPMESSMRMKEIPGLPLW